MRSVAVLAFLLLIACGGGGSGTSPIDDGREDPIDPDAPRIASVEPERGFNDEATRLTLVGTGFTDASIVRLADPASTVLSDLVVFDDTRLAATVPSGLAPGDHDLRVVTSKGTSPEGEARFAVSNLVLPDLPGAYAAGWEDTSVPGADGDRPAARITYPARWRGEGAEPDAARAPYPAVGLIHAFKPPLFAGDIDYRAYAWLADALASFGYVVVSVDMAPNNVLLGSAYVNAKADADDARAALDHLAERAATPGDRLEGMVDPTRGAVGGHSRGGSASLIAAADEVATRGAAARLLAVFGLGAPSFDFPSGGGRIPFGDFTAVPCLQIGASADEIVPFGDQLDILAQAGSPSAAFEILGGNHGQYTDGGRRLAFDGTATISPAVQHEIARRYVLAWLGAYVKGQAAFLAPYLPGGAQIEADDRIRGLTSR